MQSYAGPVVLCRFYAVLVTVLIAIVSVPMQAQDRNTARDFDGVEIHNLHGVNTVGLEYAPTITADGRHLYFVSDRPGGSGGHDIWEASLSGGQDSTVLAVRNIGGTVNTTLNEGVASIAADGQSIYFAACNRNDGVGDCDIYEARLEGRMWRIVRNLKEINSSDWDSQPTVSSDGRTLYFVSNRPGAIGGSGDIDIYVSHRTANGTWSKPQNLGAPINTPKREDSPFILPGGRALYFSSAGHGGFGGMDFFVSRLENSGLWSEPENLGASINTQRDERFITLPASGDVVYFSSEPRMPLQEGGGLDLYIGFLPPHVTNVLVAGRVFDRATGAAIAADLMFIDSATGETLYGTATNSESGEYSLVLNAGSASTIAVYGIANGYGPIRETIHITANDSYSEIRADIPLSAQVAANDDSEHQPVAVSGLRLYPNPADRVLTIEYSGIEGLHELEVLDAYGHRMFQTAMQNDRQTIDLDGMPSGIYIVRVGGNVSAFVIQR